MSIVKLACSFGVLAIISGCSTLNREAPEPGDPAYAPMPAQSLRSPEEVNGSIFQVSRNFGLYGDQIALNVGDILTVTLAEKTKSSKKAETSYGKESEIKIDEGSLLGSSISAKNLSMLTDLSLSRDFDGDAESDQSNSLDGSISVTVSEVLPNGVLRIRGEKWLTLNQGDEYIRLTGLVRPEDISTANTIPSTKVADARIAYGGTGDFDQSNRMGWGSRFFKSEWFPF
ncbi:flagellar basal body L-ring protein FlgH [Alkalimarinus alittae]|uniref:Flagellar L-ring protein n=1 Tax=Alkalimarinus alittae TaxID=2961619 RepID=A0ABY6N6S8_9ALTE|nr:flagellar basal body L-ring protein FlgH [Alkalimarinus alittae]UZE97687.1 flagellar basal body L-ring protein FlgH [Alkalimarinus alittae]